MKKNKENIKSLSSDFNDGDELAFKRFFEMHYDGLSAYINSYTNDLALTQDIIQDSFIKLWEARSNITENKSIVSYLYKIAYYTFIDNYRKHKKESSLLDKIAYEKTIELTTDDDEIRSIKIKKVLKAIDNLSPRCKEVFKMSKLQGYKYMEIAEILGISIKTIENQMGKAFSDIRKGVKDNDVFLFFISLFWGTTFRN